MWRVATSAREAPGRAGRAQRDRQVAALTAQVTYQPGWQHVATYVDRGSGVQRPGLSQLPTEVSGRVDVIAADSYGRLSPDHRELQALLAQLGGAGCALWCCARGPLGAWRACGEPGARRPRGRSRPLTRSACPG